MEIVLNFISSSEVMGTIFTVLISIIIFCLIRESTLKYISKRRKKADDKQKKRLTILNLSVSILKYAIYLIDIIIILGIFNVKVTAFLAGLGIFGVVIGLALQDLLKDFIAGIFIILDTQYSVGDYVCIDDFKGEVIGVGLKSTKVRDYGGDIRIFSNRLVTKIINFSQSNSKTVIDFTFSSDENLLRLEDAIKELMKRCKGKLPDAIGEPRYKGVEEYGNSNLVLRITCDVKPLKQYKTENQILREAKLLFDELDIKIK